MSPAANSLLAEVVALGLVVTPVNVVVVPVPVPVLEEEEVLEVERRELAVARRRRAGTLGPPEVPGEPLPVVKASREAEMLEEDWRLRERRSTIALEPEPGLVRREGRWFSLLLPALEVGRDSGTVLPLSSGSLEEASSVSGMMDKDVRGCWSSSSREERVWRISARVDGRLAVTAFVRRGFVAVIVVVVVTAAGLGCSAAGKG